MPAEARACTCRPGPARRSSGRDRRGRRRDACEARSPWPDPGGRGLPWDDRVDAVAGDDHGAVAQQAVAVAVEGDHVTGVDGDATRHGRSSSGERSYRGSARLDRLCPAWSAPGTMRIPALGLRRKQWEPLAFASPSMALIAFVIVFPLVYSFYLSFQNFDLSVGPEYEFVGAKNYTEALFRDERFMGSVWNTALLIAPSLILELLLGLGIALLLSRVLRGRPTITALLVIPSMVSPVMAAMAWRMMYGVKYGAINNLGRQLGIIDVYFA